jgi:A nuclease family of the HNH/ENDO VII superfamily with conserved AHH
VTAAETRTPATSLPRRPDVSRGGPSPPARETVEEYVKRGGRITRVPTGVSGEAELSAQPKGEPALPEGTHKITDKPNLGRLASLTDAEMLAANLSAELGHRPEGHAAHHIVPKGMQQADVAREILERAGIGINDGVNGVWLAEDMMMINRDLGLIHSKLHTNKYIRHITSLLMRAEAEGGAPAVWAQLRALRGLIYDHKVPF